MKKDNTAKNLLNNSVEIQILNLQELDTDEGIKLDLEIVPVREIVCPQCGSKDCWKRGNKKGNRKEYSCKKCQKFFLIYPLTDEEGEEIKCPDCKSPYYTLSGYFRGKRRYKCRDCNRKYVLNPNGRDDFNNLNNISCRWCGSKKYQRKGLDSKTKKQKCYCLDCQKQFTVGAKGIDVLIPPKEFDFEHDVWTTDHLGYEKGIQNHYKLNFSYVVQPWLKYFFKKYILYLSSTRFSFSTLIGKIEYIKTFSRFLLQINYSQEFKGINRQLIIEYLAYLSTNKYSYSQYTHCISTLKSFFETGIFNHWFNVEPALIRPEDWLKQPKRLPRYIPEEVMKQLNQHLDYLPSPVMRMVLIDIECGFRIGELTRLKFDCLKSNGKGDWYIQYQMHKMKKEHTKPISNELVKVIQEQQTYIKKIFGDSFIYLFCGRARPTTGRNEEFTPEPKLMKSRSFIGYLKRLAEKFEIKDNSGNIWNFQSHQFRHTVGTRMINAGVPQYIIQRYLGHESPKMTMVYAHIHDHTLRKEIEKYHESRVVNFQGEASELDETILSSNNDLEWFKKNVQARALEHGYCARPKVLGNCDISGFDGCYNCPHWRTNKNFLPVLKDTLERTNNVLQKAKNCGWKLQVNKNTPIKDNLEKVIKSLEEDND
ncbi:MAG: tyrosine-type recombinase/integrase [Richelia sp. RM1_1_1]|nr:tyrosine-type recombinase/integrase [Richelia sp. RM1_1_1]